MGTVSLKIFPPKRSHNGSAALMMGTGSLSMTQSSDRKTFERDLVALIPHLRAFGRSLCGNPTQGDDLAQDALAKATPSCRAPT
jgi:hypothetical protein